MQQPFRRQHRTREFATEKASPCGEIPVDKRVGSPFFSSFFPSFVHLDFVGNCIASSFFSSNAQKNLISRKRWIDEFFVKKCGNIEIPMDQKKEKIDPLEE